MDTFRQRPVAPHFDLDIDIGSLRDPIGPVREAFARRGIRISNETIAAMRCGESRRVHTAYRLACAEALRANNAELKTGYCLELLRAGCELREPSRRWPRIYGSFGLSQALRATLALTRQEFCWVLCTMRADLALWSSLNPDDELEAQFREAASLFLRVNRHRDWFVLHSATDYVEAAWDAHTIHGFYHALYRMAGSITRATWLPYELDVLLSFYQRQQRLRNPLTPLDREVLAGAVRRTPRASETARIVRAHVGVTYDDHCVTRHRHLLVTGSPKPVSRRGHAGDVPD